jgi:hypothetical protein
VVCGRKIGDGPEIFLAVETSRNGKKGPRAQARFFCVCVCVCVYVCVCVCTPAQFGHIALLIFRKVAEAIDFIQSLASQL